MLARRRGGSRLLEWLAAEMIDKVGPSNAKLASAQTPDETVEPSCPRCNGSDVSATGSESTSAGTTLKLRCGSCGHGFSTKVGGS